MSNELSMRPVAFEQDLLSCVVCGRTVDQPLLLRCLHNCCRQCADRLACVEADNKLHCAVCDVITDVGTSKHPNAFIAEQARLFTALRDADKCGTCREEENAADGPADFWCMQCQGSLCSACMPVHERCHSRHDCIEIDEIHGWSDVLHATGQACARHAMLYELLCFDCKKAKCVDCLPQCQRNAHSVQLLKGPEGAAFLADARQGLQRLQDLVNCKSKWLRCELNLVREIEAARALHIRRLQSNKRKIMDAISKAYDDAEAGLDECYDLLQTSAASLQSTTEQLEQTVRHASKYVASVLDSASDADLLDQRTALLSRLTVLAEQLHAAKPTWDVTELVVLDIHVPDDFERTVGAWIGTPRLATDTLGRCLADLISLKSEADNEAAYDECDMLSFGPSTGHFQSPVHCWDVAVTSVGSLLLAAREHGLKEYDMSGSELSHWSPPTQSDGLDDEVLAVEALEDGRAIAGMVYSRLVVLLRRFAGDREWVEDKRVTILQSPPMQLSVHGDFVAVAEGRMWAPGRQLLLVRLSSGHELYRENREYDILSVAVTALSVVTASSDRVHLGDGRELFVVDSYSHRGDRLWRYESGERAWDVGAAPTGRVLYLALWASDKVMAISGEDGSLLKDIVIGNSSHGLKMPVRLSHARGRWTNLVVVSGDWTTISLYPAINLAHEDNQAT